MRRQKIKAAKEREKKKAEQLKEEARLIANADRLMTMKSGFALVLNGEVVKTRVHKKRPQLPIRDFGTYVPGNHPPPVTQVSAKPRLSEEMQLREMKAQQEIREKKKLSMPLYNKGGLQYPTQEEIQAMRNGELRRRS